MSDLADRLRRFSYKPGWTIRLGRFSNIDDRRALVILASVPDVLGRPEPFVLRGAKILPPAADDWADDKLTQVVNDLRLAMEQHEGDEWFMVDGKPVNDPHGKVDQG